MLVMSNADSAEPLVASVSTLEMCIRDRRCLVWIDKANRRKAA